MKTFTAKELSRNPRQVFREADVNCSVKINHQEYPDKVFILEGRERGVVTTDAALDETLKEYRKHLDRESEYSDQVLIDHINVWRIRNNLTPHSNRL